MKRLLISAAVVVFFSIVGHGQITKGNWLVGGSLSYSSINAKSDYSSDGVNFIINLSPNIGYFIADKLAIGIKSGININGSKGRDGGKYTTYADFNLGPFSRYYFLPSEKDFNLLVEGFYQYGFIGGNSAKHVSKNTFGIQAGPVIYFNQSVGLELLAGYATYKFGGYEGRNSTINFSVGLQIHLEKNK